MDNQKKAILLKAGIITLLLSSVTFFSYRDALKGGLVWDAVNYIVGNPYITSLSWANIQWIFTSFFMSNWHPLTWLSYLMDYLIYGAFWGIALTNVLLHCFNTALFFFLSLALIGLHHGRKSLWRDAEPRDWVAAATAALLFGIHPQHVESVAWLAERKDVLCQFFILATFLFYIGYSRRQATNQRRAAYYGAALMCFILALLSKPMAVTVPVLLLIIDLYPLQKIPLSDTGGGSLSNRWVLLKKPLVEKLPFFALSLASAIITLQAQEKAIGLMEDFGLKLRFLNAANSLFVYVSKLVFPVNLLPLYDDFPNPDHLSGWIPVAAFFLTTALFIYLWRKQQQYWLAIWLFYIVALLPVIGLVQVGLQSSADRYAYLPTTPFYLLAGCAFSSILFQCNRLLTKLITVSGLLLVSLILLDLTNKQISIWRGEAHLWSYLAKRAPNGLVHTGLGDLYFSQGNYEKAVQHYQIAADLGKLIAPSLSKGAIALVRMEKWDDALRVYNSIVDKKIDIRIPWSCIYYNIGLIYARKGSVNDTESWLLMVGSDSPDELSRARQLLAIIQTLSPDQLRDAASSYRFCEKKYAETATATVIGIDE